MFGVATLAFLEARKCVLDHVRAARGTLRREEVALERAAGRILAAAMARRRHLVFPLPARLAAMAHELAPELTASLSAAVNALLPSANGDESVRRQGAESASSWSPSILTYLNEWAAKTHNQITNR